MIHRADVLFYACLAFLAGVVLASFISFSNIVVYSLLLPGTVVLGVSVYRPTFERSPFAAHYRTFGALMGFLVLLLAFGGLRFMVVDTSVSRLAEFADRSVGQPGQSRVEPDFAFVGYVASDPEERGSRQQFIFEVVQVDTPGRTVPIGEPILVTADLYPIHEFGQNLKIRGSLKPPFSSPDFDYESYLKRDGIRYVLSFAQVSELDQPVKLGWANQRKIDLYSLIFKFKHTFSEGLKSALPEPHASYINGILTGERAGISDDLRESFNRTSTSHILAISGYNISLIAQGILWALTWFTVRRRAFWISVGLVTLFAILTGGSASVVRASIMGLVLLAAQGYGRLYDSRNAMALTAAVMVLISPHILRFDVGFQLSFLALIGMVYLYPIADESISLAGLPKLIRENLLMTLSAQFAVLPLLLFYFNQFSLVSLPVNVLVLPLLPSVMLAGFIAALTGMIWPFAGQAVGLVAWALSGIQLSIITFAAGIGWAALQIKIHVLTMAGLYLALFTLVKRYYRNHA